MAKAFTRINGWPVAVGVAPHYLAMKVAFEKQFPGIQLQVYSGIRTYEGQKSLFLSRYRVQWVGNGPYGDVRWWNGLRYVRHSGEGTVAQPGTSNHETGRSLDLRDSGSDAGVAASFFAPRNVWLSQNCHRWGFTHTGKNFGEPWHFEQLQVADPWLGRGKPLSIADNDPGEPFPGTSNGAGGGAEQEEDDMFTDDDRKLLQQVRDQLGGAADRKTSLRQDVDEIGREVSTIRKLIGRTVARAKNGDTIGVSLDKIIAHLGGRKKLGPKD